MQGPMFTKDNRAQSLTDLVAGAMRTYQARFGALPAKALVNQADYEIALKLGETFPAAVQPVGYVLTNCVWVGA